MIFPFSVACDVVITQFFKPMYTGGSSRVMSTWLEKTLVIGCKSPIRGFSHSLALAYNTGWWF